MKAIVCTKYGPPRVGDGGCNLVNFFKFDFRESFKYNYILYITI